MSNTKERAKLAEEAKSAIAAIGTIFGARKRAERAIDKLASLPPEQAAQVQEPLSRVQILNGFCKAPHVNQFVLAFEAGARFAERAHGIGVQLTKEGGGNG